MGQPRSIPGNLRPGYNASGADIGAYLVVKKSSTVDDGILLPAANTDPVFAVTRELISIGNFGTLQTTGLAICTASATVTKGQKLGCDTAGKVLPWTAGAVVGVANRSAANGDNFEVELDFSI
jgi:hypothetical protein